MNKQMNCCCTDGVDDKLVLCAFHAGVCKDRESDDLRALREFARMILLSKKSFFPRIEAERLGLLDADGNPTRRLAGE